MEQEIQQLKERVTELENMLTILGMPYDLKELIRNEVIKGEDSTITLLQSYEDSNGDTVIAPKQYLGVLRLESKGRIYFVPHLANN